MILLPSRRRVNLNRLRLARTALIVALVLTLGLFAVGIPLLASRAGIPCSGSACYGWQETPRFAVQLAHIDLSLHVFAVYIIALEAMTTIGFCLIGAAIAWRRPDEPIALFAAFMLVTFGPAFADVIRAAAISSPYLFWVRTLLAWCGWSSLLIFLYVFPNGRFVPRWTRWVAIAWAIFMALYYVSPPAWGVSGGSPAESGREQTGGQLFGPGLMVFFAIAVLAQIYRYWYVSTPIQRQQTKWVFSGLVATCLGLPTALLLFSKLLGNSPNPVVHELVGRFLFAAFLLLIPTSLAIAVTRHRLWDVDVLINRTLVYGSLTLSLAGLYIGGVIGLQALFRTITDQSSDLAIAIATLAVAALFNPWRHRVQTFIDHRFYRRKYDAARVLATFTSTLRDEVDLDRLTDDILVLVADTIQPEHATLWLPKEAGS